MEGHHPEGVVGVLERVLFDPEARGGNGVQGEHLGRKLLSCSHGQECGQLAALASDWLFTLV